MWLHFALIFLAGTALVDSTAWKPNHVYQYIVRSRALAGVKVADQVTGVLMKGQLNVHVTSSDVLMVEFNGAEYASIHKSLPDGFNAHVPDNEVKYVGLPTIKDPLKVTLRNGQIDEIFASPSDSENPHTVNIIKGILSHLQFEIDLRTQKKITKPGDSHDYQVYTTKEQTVSGFCDTEYEMTPLFREDLNKTNLPYLEKSNEDGYLRILKYKDYKNCVQGPKYQFTMTDNVEKNIDQEYITRSSSTNMIISHKKQYFTIWSSVMENTIQVRPRLKDMETSRMFNMMNVTLVKVEEATKEISVPTDVVSTGNLTYVYNMRERNRFEFYHPDLDNMNFQERSRESFESDRHRVMGRNRVDKNRDRQFDRSESEENKSESNSREHRYFIRKREVHERKASHNLQDHLSDMTRQANILVDEIATEIMTPDELVNRGTLEKYAILTKVFRHMDETSIAAVENKLQIAHKTVNKQDEKKIIAWGVFRDAVAQAGTLDALKIIHKWVVTKRLTNLGAAAVIGQLPRVVREPLPKYIQQFYELIKLPEVRNAAFVNSTAPYAFAEMVRYALVLDQKYIYPRSSNAIIKPEEKKKQIATYISYFSDELHKAYKARHNSGIVTYIWALGNIAHPDIIHVFEPYLEGERKLTTFQRATMVSAMEKIFSLNPETIRPIVHKIYLNQKEHYEVRVMAVKLLLNSHPPKHILMSLAEKASWEPDPQVKNAIITGIDSLTKLTDQQYERIVKDAIAANEIILRHDPEYNYKYSTHIMQDYVNKQKDYAASFDFATVASEIKGLPKFTDIAFRYNSSHFSPPAVRTKSGVSDVNIIVNVVMTIIQQITSIVEQTTVDELAEKLNIVYNKEEVEGSVTISDEYRVFVIVFDRDTMENIINTILRLKETTKDNYHKEYISSLLFNREFVIGYPSEIGIPVNYRLNVPQLVSIKNKMQTKGNLLEIGQEVDAVISKKTISRITFVTLFNNEEYFAGVDVDGQIRVPGVWSAQLRQKANKIKIEYKPAPGTNRAKLWQYSVVPYTGNVPFPNFKSVRTSKDTHPIIIGKVRKVVTSLMFKKILVKQETCDFRPDVSSQFNLPSPTDIFKSIMKTFVSEPLHYQKQEISNNYSPEDENSVSITIDYANTSPFDTERTSESMRAQEEIWSNLENKMKEPHSITTVHVRFQMLGDNVDFKCYGGVAQFYESFDTEVRAKCDLHNSDPSKITQICAELQVNQTPSGCPTINVSSDKMRQFKALVRYGKSCEDGKEINIKGIQKQSENVKEKIINSKTYEQSKKEVEAGNMGLVNSEKICNVIDFMDELAFSVKMDWENVTTVYYSAIKWLVNRAVPNMNIDLIKPSGSKTPHFPLSNFINFNIKRQLQSKEMDVTVTSGPLVVHVPVRISAAPFATWINNEIDSFSGINNEKKFCTIGQTKVKTFGNKVYPIEMNRCPRMIIVNPTNIIFNSSVDIMDKFVTNHHHDHNIAIWFEDLGDGKRQITTMYKNKPLHFTTSESGDTFYVDGKPLTFHKDTSFIEKNPDFKVVKITPVIYEITIRPAEIVILFNGRRIHIQASDAYNGYTRGLCGNKDDNKETDFIIPQGCVVKKPKHFIASYTFDSDKCIVDEDTKRMKKEAMEKCRVIEVEYRQANVVDNASQERGHTRQSMDTPVPECTVLRTHIRMDRSGEACFSMRPIPVCAEGCESIDIVSKPISYHCEILTPEVLEMIKRIKAGANPDFSTKTQSMVKYEQISTGCIP